MEKIQTLHPQRKKGVNIDRDKYQAIRHVILASLRDGTMLTYTEMARLVQARLGERFSGPLDWHVEVVKLDLEARQLLKRVRASKPDRYRRVV